MIIIINVVAVILFIFYTLCHSVRLICSQRSLSHTHAFTFNWYYCLQGNAFGVHNTENRKSKRKKNENDVEEENETETKEMKIVQRLSSDVAFCHCRHKEEVHNNNNNKYTDGESKIIINPF